MGLGFFSCQGIKNVKNNKGYLYIIIILQVTVPFMELVRRKGKRKSYRKQHENTELLRLLPGGCLVLLC